MRESCLILSQHQPGKLQEESTEVIYVFGDVLGLGAFFYKKGKTAFILPHTTFLALPALS